MKSISKNAVFALLSGILMALSWPTYGFPFLMFIAWVPLLLMEHETSLEENIKRKGWKIFGWSYLTFLIFNIITIHWLWLVSINQVGAFVPTVVLNALLMSLFFMLYHYCKRKLGTVWGLVCLPFIWIIFEKIHLNWELNWPWLNLGNVFANYHEWIQWYSITGTLGGTLWLLAINALVFYYYKIYLVTRDRKYFKTIGLSLVLGIGIPSVFSWYLYQSYEDVGEEVEVLMLQPEIDPYGEKYYKTPEQLTLQLASLMREGSAKTQLVVGPETAIPGRGYIPFETRNFHPIILFLTQNLPNENCVLVTGVEVEERVNGEGKDVNFEAQSGVYSKRYNAAIQMEQEAPTRLYVKSKLVPMVEYFSYQNLLKPLLGQTMLDFGGSTNTLARPSTPEVFTNSKNNLKIAPTVCYESVFGEYTAEFVKKGANLITISTNDSWWQDSQGHKQLLAYAKLRALENRRYIARSANSGISAVINGRGDIVSSLPYLYEGVLPGWVKLHSDTTYYTENGDYLGTLAFLFMGIILGYLIAIRLKKYLP